MEFVESILVSSFDIIFILSELSVDGIGYVAWLVYAAVTFDILSFTYR